ncbi:MAG: hypothetical protein ACT4OV_14065 [Microthrixaceae bacterium]
MFPNDLSFDPRDPQIPLPSPFGSVGLQIFTTSNVYGMAADALEVRTDADGGVVASASRLAWAGQQQVCDGSARVVATRVGSSLQLRAEASHHEPIKALKLVFGDLPDAVEAGFWHATSPARSSRKARPLDPLLWRYPWPADDPWPEWETPWAAAGPADDGTTVTISVRDDHVRPVRLYAHCPPWAAGKTVVEVVWEEDANAWGSTASTPPITVGVHQSEQAALADLEDHLAHVRDVHRIPRWEARTDVPAWFSDTRLVVTLHGMHWTGYAFNTFDEMTEILRLVADHVEGRRVLAYLPGWEGRYYHAYPHYEPAAMLGGRAGFDRLIAGAHELGVRLMPMFGMHGVNAAAFEAWEESSFRTRTNRMPALVNKPDWDGDRSGEDDQVFCNPGHAGFRAHLLSQLDRVAREHDIDGVFLDTSACWINDPRHNLLDGYRALVGDLRERHPRLLVAGEGWFDALLSIFPVNQTWHDPAATFRCPDVMSRFARAMPHLSVGAPGRGSTGVHEAGWAVPPVPGAPVAPHVLRNISFVDDTLRDHVDAVIAILREVDAAIA